MSNLIQRVCQGTACRSAWCCCTPSPKRVSGAWRCPAQSAPWLTCLVAQLDLTHAGCFLGASQSFLQLLPGKQDRGPSSTRALCGRASSDLHNGMLPFWTGLEGGWGVGEGSLREGCVGWGAYGSRSYFPDDHHRVPGE